MGLQFFIRKATKKDQNQIWEIIQQVISAGDTYVFAPDSGKRIGKFMGEYSIIEAKRLGYKAMQFNMVVKSNEKAIRLWKKLGFEIKGEIPEAFNHREKGLTDTYIMWKKL